MEMAGIGCSRASGEAYQRERPILCQLRLYTYSSYESRTCGAG